MGLQSKLALQQVELLFDIVVELILVSHSLVENLHGLGGGDSLLHGHSHISKLPMLWKRSGVAHEQLSLMLSLKRKKDEAVHYVPNSGSSRE